jgi:hypothetical protein
MQYSRQFLAALLTLCVSCGELANGHVYNEPPILYCPVEEAPSPDVGQEVGLLYTPAYPIAEEHGSCAHELSELCREVEALADAGLFSEQHFQWLCKGIGREYFICP